MTDTDIQVYNSKLEGSHQEIADGLCELISATIPNAEGKVWHGHPAWFIDGNPVVGYSLKKAGIEVLFWSGQSFTKPGLRAIGKFKAAGVAIASKDDVAALEHLMPEALAIQWNYKDLPKLRKLEKLTDF
jgi:hypothetical protein